MRPIQRNVSPLLIGSLVLALIVLSAMPGIVLGQHDQTPATPPPLGDAIPPELTEFASDWPTPMGNLAAHRNAYDSAISSETVGELEVAWRLPIGAVGSYGAITSTPLIVGDRIYFQDMLSDVYAVDRETGEIIWKREYGIGTIGPNGVAIGYGMIFGTLGDIAETFALDAETGEEIWRVKLSNNIGEGIDMAPLVYDNTVYVSTVPGTIQRFYRGGQKGILYALDASSGHTMWQFDTTTDNLWGNPRANSGGGLWYPPSVDADGNIYFGVGNAAPWPGTPDYPSGTSRPGDNDYASSMVSLDPTTGEVRWFYNAKPHDLFDLDYQNTPIIVETQLDGEAIRIAVGSGKTGTVAAVNAETGELLWDIPVGIHENDDLQELPFDSTVLVYPGSLGGITTPIAYGDGVVFVPYGNWPSAYAATHFEDTGISLTQATGGLAAIRLSDGEILWDSLIPTMPFGASVVTNDVVFTAGLDGLVRGFNVYTGEEIFTFEAAAGINAPLSTAGDLLLIPAGFAKLASYPAGLDPTDDQIIAPAVTSTTSQGATELIALRIGGGSGNVIQTEDTGATPAPATPEAGAVWPPSASTPELSAGTPVVPPSTPVTADTESETANLNLETEAEPPAPSDSRASIPVVEVAASDMYFQPSEIRIAADTTTTITLTNLGAFYHDFTVDELGIQFGADPGRTNSVSVNLPAGEYTFYCSIPGHEAAGMVGTLIVE